MNNKLDLLFETTTKQEINPMNSSNDASVKSVAKPTEHDSPVGKNESKDDKQDVDIVFGFKVQHAVRTPRKKSAKSAAKKDVADSRPDIKRILSEEYATHIETFSTTMCYLGDYINEADKKAYESLQTNYAGMYRSFVNMILATKHKKAIVADEVAFHFSKERTTEAFDVVVPVVDNDDLRSALQYFHAATAARRILAESMIQQIVNAWEHLLGSLIGTRIDSKILKDKNCVQVAFSELDNLKDVNEIKKVFGNKIIREFLWKSTDEQLKALKDDYNIDFSSLCEKSLLNDLKETILRRHSIVHCNSIATPEYCNSVKKLGKKPPNIGEELVSSKQYLMHAWDVFFAAGIIVANLFYVSHARVMKSKEMEDDANSVLVTKSHTALSHNRNEAACAILQYANKQTISDEWSKRAARINLALSYKRMGRIKECIQVLDEHNWDCFNDEFKAAEAALRGKNKEVLKLICKICQKNPSFIHNACEWVVFEDVRRDPEFEKAMQRLVSKQGKTMVKVAAPAVHFSKRTDAKAMLKKLFDIASKFKQGQLP